MTDRDVYRIEVGPGAGGRVWCNDVELLHVKRLVLRASATEMPSIELELNIGGAEALAEVSRVVTMVPLHEPELTDGICTGMALQDERCHLLAGHKGECSEYD